MDSFELEEYERNSKKSLVEKEENRLYSRKEVELLLRELYEDSSKRHFHNNNTIEEWIKDNL